MSTRRYLRDRRAYFRCRLKAEPENETFKKVVEEIDFIFDKLKEYDIKKSEAE